MLVLLVSNDLMVSSMLEGVTRISGDALQTTPPASAADQAAADLPGLVVIDLSSPIPDVGELVAALRDAAPQAKLIAFGPHVHTLKLEAARTAGCDRVMSRGEFHRKAGEVIAELAGNPFS